GTIDPYLIADPARPTSRKVRFVSEHFSTHLLRADWELAKPVDVQIEAKLIECVKAALPHAGAVVLSDYATGALTPEVISAVIDHARQRGVPVIVDPKGSDFAIYRGATIITPNRKELAEAARRTVSTEGEVAAAAAEVARIVGSQAVLVTLSEEG